MIVQCPNCDSRYRVNDANVPASGGKITCPSCQDRFIVYPDPPETEVENAFEDKTSVALGPDLRQLVDKMGHQNKAPVDDDDVGPPTEVMSSLDIPNSINFHTKDVPDDGTVEFASPELETLLPPDTNAATTPPEEEDQFASTEILDSDALEHMNFRDPSAEPSGPTTSMDAETRERAPLRTQLDGGSATQRLDPEDIYEPDFGADAQQADIYLPEYAPAKTEPIAPPSRPTPPRKLSPNNLPVQPGSPQEKAPAMPPSQPANAQAEAPDTPGPDASHQGPWKLKTSFGITYEFSDRESLQNWLQNREDLEGYELAGSAEFFPVDAWPQFQGQPSAHNPNRSHGMPNAQTPAPVSGAHAAVTGPSGAPRSNSGAFQQTSNAPNSGSSAPQGPPPSSPGPSPWDSAGPVPPVGKVIEPNSYQPPSRDSKANWLLWPVAGVLFAIVVLLIVQVTGLYDIKSAVLGEPPPAAAPEQPSTPGVAQPGASAGSESAAPEDPQAVSAENPQGASPEVTKAVDRLIEDAERALENNRLQSASAKLNNAKLLDPERISIYVLLVDVFTRMGRQEEAATAQKTLDELRGTDGTPPVENTESKTE